MVNRQPDAKLVIGKLFINYRPRISIKKGNKLDDIIYDHQTVEVTGRTSGRTK